MLIIVVMKVRKNWTTEREMSKNSCDNKKMTNVQMQRKYLNLCANEKRKSQRKNETHEVNSSMHSNYYILKLVIREFSIFTIFSSTCFESKVFHWVFFFFLWSFNGFFFFHFLLFAFHLYSSAAFTLLLTSSFELSFLITFLSSKCFFLCCKQWIREKVFVQCRSKTYKMLV